MYEDRAILKIIVVTAIFFHAFCLPPVQFSFAQELEARQTPTPSQSQDLSSELNKIKEHLQEVRRDQLNYKIEKDLLKETYSSNLDKINTGITIALAAFTILGLIGLGSLWRIIGYFRNELNQLIALKVEYKTKFSEIDKLDKKYRSRFRQLRKTNIEQDRRLELLEIQEKVSSLIKSENFSHAKEEIVKGLVKFPNDQILLFYQIHCLFKLKEYEDAIPLSRKLLEDNPHNMALVVNVAEAYLILEKFNDYNGILEKYSSEIINHYTDYLTWYFEAIRLYLLNDTDKLKEHILSKLDIDSNERATRISNWDYGDIEAALVEKPESLSRTWIFMLIHYLQGNINDRDLIVFVD